MKLEDFIAAVYNAGWRNTSDGQHTEIKALHKKLFPIVSELEEHVAFLDEELRNLNQERIEIVAAHDAEVAKAAFESGYQQAWDDYPAVGWNAERESKYYIDSIREKAGKS